MSPRVNGEESLDMVHTTIAEGHWIPPAGNPPTNVEVESLGDDKGYYIKRSSAPVHDPINHPNHYTQGAIEVIDFIEDQKLPHHEASAVAYICRARHTGREIQDLKKAIWYLNRRVMLLEKGIEAGQ